MVENQTDEVDPFEISVDLQRDILNLVIMDRNFLIDSMSLVKPGYFVNAAHRSICEVTQKHFEQFNVPITREVLEQELRDKHGQSSIMPEVLAEMDIVLERTDDAYAEKEYLAKAVVDFAKAQAMKYAILQAVDLIPTKEYDKIEELIRDALLVAPETNLGINLFQDISTRYQRIISALDGEKFTTALPSIDKDLMGGLSRKEIGMVFAPPGVGKSIYLAMVAIRNVMAGKKVIYVSCEMSEDRVAMRTDAMMTMLPIKELTNMLVELKERLKTIAESVEGDLQFKEFPSGAATISDIKAYTNQLYNYTGFQPDVIILDYIDEVKCSNPRLDTYDGQAHTTREFRAWMVQDDLCGYTATQSNRVGRQVKIITDAEVGDSYGKVRIVDAMWSLNQSDDEKQAGVARWYVVKHRNGNARYVKHVKINKKNLRITEVSEAQYNQILEQHGIANDNSNE